MFHTPVSKRAFIISLLIMISLTLMIYGFIQLNSLSIYDENRWESIRVMETFTLNNFGVIELKSGEFIEIPFTYTGNDSSYSNFMERILTEREVFSKMAPQLFDHRWLIIHIETDNGKVNVFLLNFDQWYQWYHYEKRNETHEPRDYILSFKNVSKLDKLVVVNDTFYGESEPYRLEYCRFSCYFIVLVENPSSEQIKLKYFVTDQVAVLTPYTYTLEKSPQVYKYILFGSILMWLSLGLITPELGFFIISSLSKFMPQEIRKEASKLVKEYRLWKKRKYVKVVFLGLAVLVAVTTYLRVAIKIDLPHGLLASSNEIFWPSELRNLEGSYLQLLELDLYTRQDLFINLLLLGGWIGGMIIVSLTRMVFLVAKVYFRNFKKKIIDEKLWINNYYKDKAATIILANLTILIICFTALELNFVNELESFLLKSSPFEKTVGNYFWFLSHYNFYYHPFVYYFYYFYYEYFRVYYLYFYVYLYNNHYNYILDILDTISDSVKGVIAVLILINLIYWGINGTNLYARYTHEAAVHRILVEERRRFKTNIIITILTTLIVYPISSYLSHISITLESLIYYTLLALIAPIIAEFYTKEYLRMLDNL